MDAAALTARVGSGVAKVPAAQWDMLPRGGNPFLDHAFLAICEESGSATPRTGWQPLPLLVERGAELVGAAPAYAKSHSQGEYVFDHGWADAWARAGGSYYPKLQIAVPFTPVPGPRLLAADPRAAGGLIGAAESLVAEHGLSSAHATFVEEAQVPLFEAAGWLIRVGSQFHWTNADYASFADFAGALASRKRKAILKERAAAQGAADIVHLTGGDLTEAHWDAFWGFYQDTGTRKWGRPYLTRTFFSLLGERMADKVLLILAMRGGRPIAGALNLIGEDALYGRYWGCSEDVPFLHFELCYYQAIDAAIARRLARVEAGAQGEHKLARGYLPVPTFSAHHIPNPGFRRAVSDFLAAERRGVEQEMAMLDEMGPFRRG